MTTPPEDAAADALWKPSVEDAKKAEVEAVVRLLRQAARLEDGSGYDLRALVHGVIRPRVEAHYRERIEALRDRERDLLEEVKNIRADVAMRVRRDDLSASLDALLADYGRER